ncbi:Protein of unknown function [Pyronema omphalodes CBS 100304]|uniref:Uncharacterized protein n=1 Tax=Pyronema omphalodes (strain CBS 100304) TaxID=1076935 RepID=U4LRR9_PYROM|nr:Protein of unknown function [Pyronema omphalodes CBS 100304]
MGISFVTRSSPFIVPTVKLRYVVIQKPAADKKSLVSAPSFCLLSFALEYLAISSDVSSSLQHRYTVASSS